MPSIPSDTAPPGTTPIPSTEQYNVLFYVGESEQSDMDLCFIVNVRSDLETTDLSVMFLPSDIKMNVDGSVFHLGSSCRTLGLESSNKSISDLLNISIKYYVFLNYDEYTWILNILPVSFNLSIALQNTALGINLEEGLHKYGGDLALQLLRFYYTDDNIYSSEMLKFYNGRDMSRVEMEQNFFANFINQNLNNDNMNKFNSVLEYIVNNCETNINADDIPGMVNCLTVTKAENTKYYIMQGNEYYNGGYYLVFNNQIKNVNEQKNVYMSDIIQNFISS
jgi:anionic cell wall polymer biosynthesis LytR-Cps2A-Psr (LCP) family protein